MTTSQVTTESVNFAVDSAQLRGELFHSANGSGPVGRRGNLDQYPPTGGRPLGARDGRSRIRRAFVRLHRVRRLGWRPARHRATTR